MFVNLFSAVLRDHHRLASKLTSDELKAIRDYIEERLRQEQADVNFRLYALRNDYDVTVRRSSETISELVQELSEKKEVIKHYQNSDQNISVVIKQKEQRWEKKQEIMLTEIEKLEGEATKAQVQLQFVKSDLEQKINELNELHETLEESNTVNATIEEAKQVLKERHETKNDLLKVKMEVDKRDKQIQLLDKTVGDLRKTIDDADKGKKMSELKVASMQGELRKQVTMHLCKYSQKETSDYCRVNSLVLLKCETVYKVFYIRYCFHSDGVN